MWGWTLKISESVYGNLLLQKLPVQMKLNEATF